MGQRVSGRAKEQYKLGETGTREKSKGITFALERTVCNVTIDKSHKLLKTQETLFTVL